MAVGACVLLMGGVDGFMAIQKLPLFESHITLGALEGPLLPMRGGVLAQVAFPFEGGLADLARVQPVDGVGDLMAS